MYAEEWISSSICGQPPSPCSNFTFTKVGEKRAALFGGVSGSVVVSDDLLVVELNKDTVVSAGVHFQFSVVINSYTPSCA